MNLFSLIAIMSILADPKPFDPHFSKLITNYVANENKTELCIINNKLQYLLMTIEDERDVKLVEDALEFMKGATQELDNFDCQTTENRLTSKYTGTQDFPNQSSIKTLIMLCLVGSFGIILLGLFVFLIVRMVYNCQNSISRNRRSNENMIIESII